MSRPPGVGGWSATRVAAAALTVLTALVLQLTVVGRLPVPGGPPDLPLVVVLASALAQGQATGLLLGFTTGLAADLAAGHAVGQLALVYAVVGYGAGVGADLERSTLGSLLTVAAGAAAAVLLYAGLGALTGDPRVTPGATLDALPSQVLGAVVLAPFVVPAVAALSRRLDPEARR